MQNVVADLLREACKGDLAILDIDIQRRGESNDYDKACIAAYRLVLALLDHMTPNALCSVIQGQYIGYAFSWGGWDVLDTVVRTLCSDTVVELLQSTIDTNNHLLFVYGERTER